MVNRKDDKLGEDQAIKVTEGRFIYVSIDKNGNPIKIK
jgi:acyl-CoA hydrolase